MTSGSGGPGEPGLQGDGGESSALEPGGAGVEPAGVDMLAAALRADRMDLASYEKVLFSSLADSLPAGVVEVQRERSMSDRVAGRPGKATAIRVRLAGESLEITERRGVLVASIAREVRGVTISRRDVTVAEWSHRLAELLEAVANESASTREALARLLGTS
jgi:hypothetical protein